MIYAEAAHFDGHAVAHCAARDDHLRRQRIAAQTFAALEARRNHNHRRAAPQGRTAARSEGRQAGSEDQGPGWGREERAK